MPGPACRAAPGALAHVVGACRLVETTSLWHRDLVGAYPEDSKPPLLLLLLLPVPGGETK